MTNRFLLGLVLVAFTAFLVVFSVVEGMNMSTENALKPIHPIASANREQPPSLQLTSSTSSSSSVIIPSAISFNTSTKTDSDPKLIQDVDLKSLASLVNLAAAKQGSPNKDQWTQAIPIANKLLQGPCDCEQRNWLNQFVTMGNYALAGSPQYYQSARLMDTLPLNDQDVRSRYNSN